MFRSFGPMELLIILLIVLLIFGARKLPDIGASLGKGIRAFKSSVTGDDEKEKAESKSVNSVHSKTGSNDPPYGGYG